MDREQDNKPIEQQEEGGLKEKRWREENEEAIAAYNARIARDGAFGARKRRF